MKISSNSRESQCDRLLAHLRSHSGITTFDARENLNICHPAGRINDLRKRGHDILTHWEQDTNAQGYRHRVARYVLMKSAEALV